MDFRRLNTYCQDHKVKNIYEGKLVDNYRPVQSLNGREIRASFQWKCIDFSKICFQSANEREDQWLVTMAVSEVGVKSSFEKCVLFDHILLSNVDKTKNKTFIVVHNSNAWGILKYLTMVLHPCFFSHSYCSLFRHSVSAYCHVVLTCCIMCIFKFSSIFVNIL